MDKATGEMPFLDHLEELRSRLFKVLAAAVVGIGIGLWLVLRFDAIGLLTEPIRPHLVDTNGKLTILGVTDQFLITLKLGAVVGLVLASPIILYQTWAFLSPALYERERKAMIPALFVGLVLFMCGVAAGWFFVLPKAIPIMLGFQPEVFNLSITYDRYFPFVIQILLALGISAEVPLVMILLAAIGIFDARRYNAFRRYAVLLAFVGGAFMSPGGDVFLMLLLTLPLLLLYEVGVAGSYLVQRKERRDSPSIAGGVILAVLLFGGGGINALAAQDRPPPGRVGEQDTTRVRRPGEARQMDSATAKRLGLPTGPSRPFAGPDSVMEALLRRRGFAVTRYLGDTAILVADSQRILLTGQAATERDGAILEAERILYADARCELVATGEPRMFEEGKIAIGRTLRFDTCGERGIFDDAFTTFDELGDNWFVRGNLAVDSSASRLYASSSEFTSCDLPLPHYEFRAGKVKWVSQSYLVARPAVLYIRDVPVAWLPFLFQDTKPGRRSGILIPQFGFNDIVRPTRGYNRQITNIGYYWAPNPYMDATFRLDWLSSRYIQFGGDFNYAWRNRFIDGGIALNRQIEVEGSTSTQLQWNHQQAFSAASQINFNLNYVTDSRVMADNAIDPLLTTQQISSAANFTRRFAWGNVTIGGTRRQNVTDGSGTMTLPSLTITPSPIAIGRHVTWSPTFQATNDVGFKTPLTPQLVVGGGVIDTVLATGSSRSSQLNFDTPVTIAGFTWRNRLSFADRVITARTVTTRRVPNTSTPEPNDSTTLSLVRDGTFDSALNWETGINLPPLLRSTLKLQPSITIKNVVSSAPFRIRNPETNGEWAQQSKRLEASLSARPEFFGFLRIPIGPFQTFRHQFSPSISMAWSPVATVPEEFARALAASRSTGTAEPPRMLLTIGLSQNFQGKPRPRDGDTTTDPRGVRPISLLSINSSQIGYDFEQAKLEGRTGHITQTLTNQVQSELVQGLTLSFTHDLWKGQVGTDTATFDPFLQNVNANFTLTDRTFRGLLALVGLGRPADERATRPDTAAPQYTRQADSRFRPGSFGAGTPLMGSRQRGFTASVSYTLSRQRDASSGIILPPIDPDDPFGGLPLPVAPFQGNRSSVSLNMSFSPTTFWSARWQTQYNITDGRFESHQVQLERDLHDWRAGFNFVRNANGNFALYFNVYLLSLPDIKFDYNQTTLQP
jgi:sec-independent protein translocase protein TatC